MKQGLCKDETIGLRHGATDKRRSEGGLPPAGSGPALSRRAWAAAAAVVIVAVAFWAALSHRVYNRTLPVGLIEHLFGEDDDAWLSALVVLRKLYSLVAFTLTGFVVHKALPPVRRPALRAALIVAGQVGDLREGVSQAAHSIASGAAFAALETLRRVSAVTVS